MARPRVFISSTYYDLKHIRSSLDGFVRSLGFDPVLFEQGDVAFSPDVPLDESCYREASSADIFVLIIGGRYGSAASTEAKESSHSSPRQYESITRKEYDSACAHGIPIYILIERNVYSEYQTYLMNKSNEAVKYAHVESVNVFRFIEDILSKRQNNPIHAFDHFSDMEDWLRAQWAGRFRELLHHESEQKPILALSEQVENLRALNDTLKRYLEEVVSKVSPDKAAELIESESKRLEEIEQTEKLRRNPYYERIRNVWPVTVEGFKAAILAAETYSGFVNELAEKAGAPVLGTVILPPETDWSAIAEINKARILLGKEPFPNVLVVPFSNPQAYSGHTYRRPEVIQIDPEGADR